MCDIHHSLTNCFYMNRVAMLLLDSPNISFPAAKGMSIEMKNANNSCVCSYSLLIFIVFSFYGSVWWTSTCAIVIVEFFLILPHQITCGINQPFAVDH